MMHPELEETVIKVGGNYVTVLDENLNGLVDQFIKEREAGLTWAESQARKERMNPLAKLGPRPEIDPKPRECTECGMTGKVYVNDYICIACRDRSDLALAEAA